MKKILYVILLLISVNGLAQTGFPGVQSMANASTRLLVNGGLEAKRGIINGVFTDTTAANADYIDFYNGAQIYTRSDRNFWLRDSVLNMWIRMAKYNDIGGVPTLQQVLDAGNSFNNNSIDVDGVNGGYINLIGSGGTTAFEGGEGHIKFVDEGDGNGATLNWDDITGGTSKVIKFPDYTANDYFVIAGFANVWGDGVRQTFNPNGTNSGINVGSNSGNPSAPSNGDIFYESGSNELRARINGAWVALGAGGAADGNGIYSGSGSLSGNTTVTQSTNTMTWNSSTTGGQFVINNTNGGNPLQTITTGNGIGLWVEVATGTGFYVTGGNNAELWDGTSTQDNTNSLRRTSITTLLTTGIVAAGFGQVNEYRLESSTSTTGTVAAKDAIVWSDPTHASRTSWRDFYGMDNAVEERFMNIQPTLVRINNDADTLATLADVRAGGGGGYTNLTQFVAQTNHRLFYSDGSGDVQELAFGSSGEYLKSNGASSAPSWDIPSGSGTVNTGAALKAAYYPSGGTTVDDVTGVEYNNTNLLAKFITQATTDVGVEIKLASSQTANALNISSNSGTGDLANITKDGYGEFQRVGTGGTPSYPLHIQTTASNPPGGAPTAYIVSSNLYSTLGIAATFGAFAYFQGGSLDTYWITGVDQNAGSGYSIRAGTGEVAIWTQRNSGNPFVGININPARKLHIHEENSTTNAVTYIQRNDIRSSGTPDIGIGGGTEWMIETATGNHEIGAIEEVVTTDVTSTNEDFDYVVKLMAGGAAAAEKLRVISTGELKVQLLNQDDAETKVVVWNSTDKIFEWRDASTLGGGSSTFAALTDVNLTSLATNDILRWDGTDWINVVPSSSNLRSIVTDENGTGALLFSGNTSATFNTPVIDGAATGTGVASIATASTLVIRDADANFAANNIHVGYTTTATAGGTTTLTIASTRTQFFTGSTTQNCDLPVVSTLPLGTSYNIYNNSTGLVTVRSSGGNTVSILAAGTSVTLISTATSGTGATVWGGQYIGLNFTAGKKITVNNTIELSGTDGTIMTFPSTSATIARTDAAQTFAGVQTFSSAPVISSITNTGTLTLPTVTSTVSSFKEAAITSNATWSPSGDARENFYDVTAQAAAVTTISNPSGTAANHNTLIIRVKDNGTARALTWSGTEWRAGTNLALPTTTTLSKTMYIKFIYNSTDTKWDLISVIDGL